MATFTHEHEEIQRTLRRFIDANAHRIAYDQSLRNLPKLGHDIDHVGGLVGFGFTGDADELLVTDHGVAFAQALPIDLDVVAFVVPSLFQFNVRAGGIGRNLPVIAKAISDR